MKRIKFVGLDVHAETISVAVAEQEGEIRSLGMIPHREESLRKLVQKLGPAEELRFCYEAGPTGYALYWQLTRMGQMRGGGAHLGAGESRRSRENGSAGCVETGEKLSGRRVDGGMGAGCGSRGIAGFSARPGSG
jgi:hypothetical protein